MKKRRQFYFIILILGAVLGCTEENTLSINGFWQLKTIERAGTKQSVDTAFLGIQSKALFSFSELKGDPPDTDRCYGRVEFPTTDSIKLILTYYDLNKPEIFSHYWYSDTITLFIAKLTVKQLILKNDNAEYDFKKY